MEAISQKAAHSYAEEVSEVNHRMAKAFQDKDYTFDQIEDVCVFKIFKKDKEEFLNLCEMTWH